jgi:FlaA1/EpsC-like NDP-sugar epimerase
MGRHDTPEWRRFLPPADSGSPSFRFAREHAGQCVLVTGAGGSIGSALVQALAGAGVARLLLVDSSENSLFELQSKLHSDFGRVPHEALLGSVVDTEFVDEILTRFRPDLVYHAAAWKQVPLLEENPFAAVRNNVLGTYVLAQSALRSGVPKLVLISTDKAVNPRSMLGVSKRIAELIVVSLSSPACRMNAIRLCNVIGSSGSVVPVFQRQIAQRKPVTVTDPRASRWFLTAHQAVEAILACGACGPPGRILLPDAGEPVRIAELAEFLIEAAGAWELPVVFTALRPGDKLHEETVFAGERADGNVVGSLEVIETHRLDPVQVHSLIHQLTLRISQRALDGLLRALVSTVPEYVPGEQVRQAAGIPAAPA